MKTAASSGFSRIPLYEETLDRVIGVVYAKDLLGYVSGGHALPSLGDVARPPYLVPETRRADELLTDLRRDRVHLAIVVDEYGGTAGVITVEDLIEEIVGEIRDEYDVESEPIVDEGGGRFVFKGKVNIDEVLERLGVQIVREGFETLGGYLLSHLGRVPAVGERLELDGLSVEIVEAERRRISRVRMSRLAPATAFYEETERTKA